MKGQWIKNLFAVPEMADDESVRLGSILHMLTLWGIPVSLIFIVVRVVIGQNLNSVTHVYIGFMILTFILSRLFLQRGHFRLVARVLIFLAWVGLAYLMWISHGFWEGLLIGYLGLTLISGLLLGTADSFFFLLTSIAAIWGITYAEVTYLALTQN